MDNLLNVFESSLSVSSEDRYNNQRKGLFKSSSQRDPASVKEARRSQLLEDYKRKRDALVTEKRGLLNDDFNDNNEDWMEWSETKASGRKRWINKHCRNQLMLSEWLLDHPYDLETNWTCVLCPEGRRSLVVAKGGCTRSYNKNGVLTAKFKSILPNGNPTYRTNNSDLVILDCIWTSSTKQLFALDILHWRNQQVIDCDTEFRFYWLKSKLSEVAQGRSAKSDDRVCDILLPTHCLFSQLTRTLSEHDPAQVDGVLFYHKKVPYISGQTPLVGWLKPYMLGERFGVEVPQQYLSLRPETYTDLEQWVELHTHKHRRDPRKYKNRVDMDCSSSISEVSDTTTCEMEGPAD